MCIFKQMQVDHCEGVGTTSMAQRKTVVIPGAAFTDRDQL